MLAKRVYSWMRVDGMACADDDPLGDYAAAGERGLRESLEESDPYTPWAIEQMMLRDAGYEFSRSG